MKRVLFFLFLSISTLFVQAQRISKITMNIMGDVETIAIELDENVILNLSADGQIKDWGIDIYKGRTDQFRERLEPYTGRVDYFKENDNEAYRGKVRSIGMKYFTYYASFDEELFQGKIKSIGTAQIEYYGRFDDEKLRGKIKKIGSTNIQYYTSYDFGFAGKIKAIGTTNIQYYSNTDDVEIRGKLKSIGHQTFEYYTSFDRKEWRGNMKKGSRIQIINGIKFHIK
jgi:hypothetical protein